MKLSEATGIWLDPRKCPPSSIEGLQGGDFIACKVKYHGGKGWDMKMGWYEDRLIRIYSLPHRGYTLEKYLILPKT